jgi:drug/metabolite transporter (DMT)-like permease
VLPRPLVHFGRGAAVALATICFFLGVMAMPLDDATALQFTSPLFTALLSGLVLGERVARVAWLAILTAFAGVLIVLRPNLAEIGLAACYPLGAAFGMAWLILLNRKSAGDAPLLVMQFLLAVMAAPLLVGAATLLAWTGRPEFHVPAPTLEVVGKCALVAFTASVGHLLIYTATLRASAASVSPMTYVQLVIAVLLGWLWFGDAPDLVSYAGFFLIVAGGLWLWRTQARPPPPAGTPD